MILTDNSGAPAIYSSAIYNISNPKNSGSGVCIYVCVCVCESRIINYLINFKNFSSYQSVQ